MKYPKLGSQIIAHLSTIKLTTTEFRVVLNWLQDSSKFDPPASVIAERIGVRREQVTKALISLRKKEVLIDDGTKIVVGCQPINQYDIHPDIFAAMTISKSNGATRKSKSKPKQNRAPDVFEQIIEDYKKQNPNWVAKEKILELHDLLNEKSISHRAFKQKFELLEEEAKAIIENSDKSAVAKKRWSENIQEGFSEAWEISSNIDYFRKNQ